MSTTVKIKNAGQFTQALAVKILRRCANDLATVQWEQWDASFANGGQPGAKWPGLWADRFQGEISEKKALAFGKATMAFIKWSNTSRNKSPEKTAEMTGRFNRAAEKATRATHYRKGGQPLLDKGLLRASRFTKENSVSESDLTATVVIASSNFVAPFHQNGFHTSGPNFIPLTLKAARDHVKGANPRDEGFEYGVDYIMAWHGVKVPARPMIDYADPVNKEQIATAIKTAMKGVK